jgi:hypothetical protein
LQLWQQFTHLPNSTGRELWQWTQIGIWASSYGPNGGVADTLDEAKATRATRF